MSPDAVWEERFDRSALRDFIKTCGNFKLISGSVLGYELHDIIGAVFSTDILGAYCDYLESDEVAVSFEFAFARYARPGWTLADSPYHQDSMAVGADPIISTWIPLDDAGEETPGLEIVHCRVDDIYKPTEHARTNHGAAELDEASVTRLFSDYLWRPVCRAGDALAFDGHTIHRTWKTESMTRTRRSLEFRTMATGLMPEIWRTHPHATFSGQGNVLSMYVGE